MATVTYKTVIANAIGHFNAVQNAIATKNTTAAPQTDTSLLATDQLHQRIRDYLVYPNGNLAITSSGTIKVADDVTTGTNRTGYATVTVSDATGAALSINNKSTTDISVGAVSNGYYPLTASLTGSVTVTTNGWFTGASNLTDSSVIVGRIKQGTLNASTAAESSENLVVTTKYSAGYLPSDATKTYTVNAATFTDGTSSGTINVSEDDETKIENAVNMKGVTAISLTKPTEGNFYAIDLSASGTATVTSATAGYVKKDKTVGTGTVSTTSKAYVTMDSASCTIAGGGLTVNSNYSATPTVTIASGNSTNMSNVVIGAQDTTNYPYYFAIGAESAALSGKTKVTRAAVTDAHTAGYLAAKDAATVIASTSAEPTVTVNKGTATTQYVGLKKSTATIAGGGLTVNSNYTGTPTVDVSVISQTTTGSSITTEKPENGFYIEVKGTSGALSGTTKVTRAAVTAAHTAGYMPAESATNKIASTSSSPTVTVNAGSKTKYVVLASGQLANSATENVTYTEVTTPILSNGYLYINAGYYSATKISLGNLIPDFTGSEAGASHIRSGFKAYDEAGNVLTGTLGDLSLSDTYYTTSNTGFGVVTADKYNASTKYIKAGSASVSISGGSSFTPVISTVNVASSTDSDGHNGDDTSLGDIYDSLEAVTTTLPTSGHYIAVNTAAQDAKTLTASLTVGTNGWITSASNASKTATVSLNTSGVTYIPIKTASVTPAVTSLTAPQVKITTSANGFTASSSASKYYITLTNTEVAGSVKAKYTTGTAGFSYKGQTATSSASSINPTVTFDGTEAASAGTKNIYLKEGSATVASKASITGSSTALTADATKQNQGKAVSYSSASSAGSTYVTVTATTSATATLTEGYVEGGDVASTTNTSAVTYIPATALASATNGTPSNTVNINSATTYDSSTGEATKAYATTSGKTTYSTSVTIPAVTAATNSYSNKYVVGYVTAKSNAGSTTVNVGPDVTGDSVDEYVEQLYKRMLGKEYTDVSAD